MTFGDTVRKLIILMTCVSMTGCATVNGQSTKNDDMVKTIAAIIVVGAIAGAVGKQNQQSKCANNRAGFWQDHSTGKIYTCP